MTNRTIITKDQVFEIAESVNTFLDEKNEAEDIISLLKNLKITTKDFNTFRINKSAKKIRKVIIKNAENLLLNTIL